MIGIPSDDLENACMYVEAGMRILLRDGYSIEDIESLLSMILLDIFEIREFSKNTESKSLGK